MAGRLCIGIPSLLAALLLAPAAPARADDLDDVLGGFEEEEPITLDPTPERPSEAERWWDLGGSLSLGSSINTLEHDSPTGTPYGGLSRLKTMLDLQLDADLPRDWRLRIAGYGFYDFAYLIDRDRFTKQVIDQYEYEFDFKEAWMQGSPVEALDLKLGRQIVNWGRSDSIRVIDVINPLDLREPGLVDIEDLRLNVAMTKVDYFLGNWSLSAMWIPELRFNINPPFGNDFQPVVGGGVPSAFSSLLGIPEVKPDAFNGNSEWAARLGGIYPGWDVSFHFARVWWKPTHLNPNPAGLPLTEIASWEPELRHSRVRLYGVGGNTTVGSWLFKGEIAYLDGLDYTIASALPCAPPACPGGSVIEGFPVGTVERDRLDALVGIEYYGVNDWQFSLDVANRHIFNYRDDMHAFFARRNSVETAARITAEFFNSRLDVTLLGLIFGAKAQNGSFVRLSAEYELAEALNVDGGIILYQEGDLPPFNSISKNDRLFFEAEYSF